MNLEELTLRLNISKANIKTLIKNFNSDNPDGAKVEAVNLMFREFEGDFDFSILLDKVVAGMTPAEPELFHGKTIQEYSQSLNGFTVVTGVVTGEGKDEADRMQS